MSIGLGGVRVMENQKKKIEMGWTYVKEGNGSV
jgi:hypothetical protein